MSVNFGKLNKPGLGSASFGHRKTTGTSSQAAKNLSNSTPASRSSVFSFQASTRRNWVGGQNVTKGGTRYNYQNTRMELNGSPFVRSAYTPSLMSGFGMGGQMSINPNSSAMKGYIIGQTILGGMSLLNEMGVFDKLKSDGITNTPQVNTTNNNELENGMNRVGGGGDNITGGQGSAVNGALSSMESAQDSASLRAAISQSSAKLDSMEAETAKLEQELANKGDIDKLKEDLSSSKKVKDESESKYNQAKRTLDVKQKDLENKEGAVRAADENYSKLSSDYDAKAKALTNATSQKTLATNAYNSAEANYQSILQAYNAATDDVTKNTLQAKLKTAEQARDNAKEAKGKAETEYESAKTAEAQAKTAKENAYKNLDQNKKEVKTATEAYEKAKKELPNFEQKCKAAETQFKQDEEAYNTAKANVDAYNTAETNLKNHEADIKTLKKAIKQQSNRLENMDEDVISDYNSYNSKAQKAINKNNKRNEKIGDSVDSFMDRRRQGKMENSNTVAKENLEKRDKISAEAKDSQAIKDMLKKPAAMVVNGENYYTTTLPSGQTVYYRGNQPITEDIFNKVKESVVGGS